MKDRQVLDESLNLNPLLLAIKKVFLGVVWDY